MAAPGPQATQELVEFVREDLGCACPAEVLVDLRIDGRPGAFAGLPVDAVLSVGGRLLIAVCASRRWTAVYDTLNRCVETGKRLRDHGGFNRFRLVVATDERARAAPALGRRFNDLPGLDDRLHLHVIEAGSLPGALR